MAVALRGYTALTYVASEYHYLAIPAAAVAGDLALIWCFDPDGKGPQASGWSYLTRDMWFKVLTSAEITAGAIPVRGRGSSMTVYSGAGGSARSRFGKTATTTLAGSGLFYMCALTLWNSGTPAGDDYQLGTVVKAADGWKHSIHSRMVTTVGSYTLDDVSQNTYVYNVVIDPIAPPAAPIPTSPAAGSAVDRTAELSLTFTHQSSSGLPMDGARARIRVVGAGTWSYVQADGTIGASEADIVTSEGVVTLDAATLTADAVYEWAPASHDEGGWSPYATSQSITARTPPSVAVTLTTTAEDLSPTVSWVTTAGTGSQTIWEARIAPAADAAPTAPVVPGSGLVAGVDDEWTPAAATTYTNAADYKGWVRVKDSALWSPWTASAAATVSWTEPTAPSSVTLVQGAPPTITVAGVAAGADTVEVQWTDGGVWETIATVVPTGTSVSVPVPRAGYLVDREYRARITDVVDGVALPSAWTTTAAPVASTDTGEYLVAADDMTDYLAVRVHTDSPRTRLEAVAESYGLGATAARVDYGTSAGWAGATDFATDTQADRLALEAWLAAHREPFYMCWCPEREGSNRVHVPAMLIQRTSPEGVERLAQVAIGHRHVGISWVTA